jgi:hypothetical protein
MEIKKSLPMRFRRGEVCIITTEDAKETTKDDKRGAPMSRMLAFQVVIGLMVLITTDNNGWQTF